MRQLPTIHQADLMLYAQYKSMNPQEMPMVINHMLQVV